jgi:hypothetical protein
MKHRIAGRMLLVAGALLLSQLLVGEARADRRIFAYSYPYMTLPEGTL